MVTPFGSDPERSARVDPAASRRRLASALRTRPGRGQVVVGVLLALLGFAATVQVQLTRSDAAFPGARRQDLVLLLDSLESAASRAQADIRELRKTRRTLKSSSSADKAVLAQTRRQLQAMGVLAGTLPASGPGVRVTISDPGGAVGSATLLNALEELRDAGAEAIEINDSVRVVAQTYFTDTASGVRVDGIGIDPPYLLEAIGSPATLRAALIFPGGLGDEVQTLGGSVDVMREHRLLITSLHAPKRAEYASPTSGGG